MLAAKPGGRNQIRPTRSQTQTRSPPGNGHPPVKAAKTAPAAVHDYHTRLHELSAAACADSWDRSERWRNAVGAA